MVSSHIDSVGDSRIVVEGHVSKFDSELVLHLVCCGDGGVSCCEIMDLISDAR